MQNNWGDYPQLGEMAEWSIAAVLKTVEGNTSGGSNPSLSAKWLQNDFKMVVKTAFKISINRCKTYIYNDFSLYIPLSPDGITLCFDNHHSVKFCYINCYTK